MTFRLLVLLYAAWLTIADAVADDDGIKAEGEAVLTSDGNADYFGFKGALVDSVATRDTDDFKRGTMRAGFSLHYASPDEFVALGVSRDKFRQQGWSTSVNSLLLAGRKVDSRTGAGYSGRLAVTTNTPKTQIHGDINWNVRLSETTGLEVLASRDAVESAEALQRGILYNFLAISVDYAPSERLTLVALPTYQRFTDGNALTGWRARGIYGLLPEHGLSLVADGRTFDSSKHGDTPYFSPEHYSRAELGLRLRRSFEHWRVQAKAVAGKEWIDHGAIENPTWQFSFSARRSFANEVVLGGEFAYYRASDSSSNNRGNDSYAWLLARLFLSIPF